MNCEFCLALTGRFDANRECCQLRHLAGAPKHARLVVYNRVRNEEGERALAELKQKVRTEYQRQLDHKAKITRLQHDQVTAKGREESAALLKKIKEMNMKPSTPQHHGANHALTPKEFA